MAVSPGCKVRVLYDFEGDAPSDELIVYTDEILTVTRTDIGQGWWEGISPNGVRGLFPEAYVEPVDNNSYPPVQQNSYPPPPIINAPLPNQGSVDGADGWDDDRDDDRDDEETVSSYSEDKESGTVASLPRRDTGSSGITRTGTVDKSMNRFSNFVKSGGEAYIIGSSQADVKIPHKKRVSVKKNPGCGTSDGTFRNKRYFKCDPDSGVFVGLDKLMPMDDAEYYAHSKTPKRNEHGQANFKSKLRDTVLPSFLKRKNDQSLQATTVDTLKIDQRVVTFLEYNGNPVRGTVCFNGEEKDASGRVLVGLELVGNSEIIVSYCLLEAQLVRDSSLILIVFRDGGVDLVAYEPIKHKHSTF